MEKITTVSTGKEPADSYSDSINPIPKGGIAERSAKIKNPDYGNDPVIFCCRD